MWWRTVLVFSLAVIDNISAQDDVNRTETSETQSQLCCPCPPGWTGQTWVAQPSPDAVGGSRSPNARTVDGMDRGVDDCPCRARDADSEGSASVFFPNSVHAFGNVVRPDPKEDSEPLLHPEVNLAASVLETLREATDEEYRDALERDAARAAAADVTSLPDVTDGVPEEARNVVIIVSPRDMDTDDATQEASHVQETRCIHSPLGNPRFATLGNPRASSTYRAPPRKGLDDILNLPLPGGLLHKQRDSNLAASNVHENIVRADDNLNKMLSELRLKTQPSLLNLDPLKIGENINNILSGASLGNRAGGVDDAENDQTTAEVTEGNTAELTNNSFERQSENHAEPDCNTSPTNNLETMSEDKVQNTGLLKSLLQGRNNKDKYRNSFPLKNLLKLRDVELVPLDILKNKPKSKSNVPVIKLDPLQIAEAREPSQPTLFGKPSKITSLNDETALSKLNKEKFANIQTIPRRKLVTTDILDTVPSPSDDNCVRLKPDGDKTAGVDMDQLEDSMLNSSTETDDEQIIAKGNSESDLTDFSSIDSVENQQLKSNEVGEDDNLRDTSEFELVDDTEPLDQGRESDIQIISQEDIEDVPSSSIDLSEINEAEDRSNTTPEIKNPLKRLEEIRQSVVEKLDALQKSNRNALDSIKHNVEKISTRGDVIGERDQDGDSTSSINQISDLGPEFESSSSAEPIQEESRDENESGESVTFQDLQNMSDSILMASENHEERANSVETQPTVESQENDSKSDEISESDIDNVLGMDDSSKPNSGFIESRGDNVQNAKKSVCLSELNTLDQNKIQKNDVSDKEPTQNDLETLASDPFIDILRPTSLSREPIINLFRPNSKTLVDHLNDLDTKLRQSIVQPVPFPDNLNIFNTPSFNVPDISSLSANIPSLDEIRTRVSEILEGLARSADDDSSEIDSDDFASEVNPVISTGNNPPSLKSILPTLKPLEDINLDIVQLKPLPSLLGASPQTPNLPGLNMNRYKARLAIPKSLDLKPLNLVSTLGNNGGLVGATLSIEPEKKHKSGKSKAKNNSGFTKSFRGPSENSPSLADITSTVHKNALNLLNLPKRSKGPYLQASNVIEELAENIKTNTEDTLRSVHETFKPASLSDVHDNLLRNANNLLNSGRSGLEQTFQASAPIDSVVSNLRSQTENTMKQLQNTLQSPRIPDLSKTIQKNTHSILKSSRGPLEATVDRIKVQSDNAFRNIQQTLDTSTLADISNSIHKTAQNVLQSSPAITPPTELLGSPLQGIPAIHEVADNLRTQTENTLKNIHQTLNVPSLTDLGTNIQKSAEQVLKSPIKNLRPELLRSTLQPSTSIDTIIDNLNAQSENTIRTIQNTLNTPTLADIGATVQKHAENLLNSPVAVTGRQAFEQVLQASPSINLAPHAEQVAKDFQKTLKATLKSSPIKDLPPIPDPNEVLQIISNHHEDVNDKLYALHTDLTDRLETIHNEVTDPERLRSILSPPGNNNFELFTIPLPMASRSAQITQKQQRPTTQAKKVAPQRKVAQKPAAIASRTRPDKAKLGSVRTATGKEGSSKSFRIPAASSSISTQTIRPTLSLTPKSQFKSLQDIKKPVLPKLKPLTVSKVTPVTFGSPRPSLKSNKIVTTTAKPKVSNNKRFKPKAPVRQPTPWNGWGEARSAPKRLGEPLTAPSRTIPNVRPSTISKSVKPLTKPKLAPSPLSTISPRFKSPPKPIKTSPLTQSRASISDSKLSSLSKSKSPLLTKLSEALKSKPADTRLSHISRGKSLGMSAAASERFENVVPLEEPMKEHVPYKCKMMCVKVDLDDESK